nr:MAG TPA: hypothetical protein [Bacteriophage sp.]
MNTRILFCSCDLPFIAVQLYKNNNSPVMLCRQSLLTTRYLKI